MTRTLYIWILRWELLPSILCLNCTCFPMFVWAWIFVRGCRYASRSRQTVSQSFFCHNTNSINWPKGDSYLLSKSFSNKLFSLISFAFWSCTTYFWKLNICFLSFNTCHALCGRFHYIAHPKIIRVILIFHVHWSWFHFVDTSETHY